ncbi:MAG: lipoate--protein ligase family protein, partial [Pirellulaceae bacterium]|nr:lipoate--protein ligase family protein [Pirellulaceae bacterium]
MKLLDLTLPTPAENLALDEALLEAAERAGQPTEVLRVWESPTPAVIIGRASQAAAEVELDYCRDHQIPVLRRGSGGAAVVIGPGCLMYAVVLSYDLHPELRMISRAHCFVLQRLAEALRPYQPGVACQGSSDLTVGVRKFSGNSLRCRRSHLLYHGTLLYNFTLDSVGQCLRAPPRQPDYRESR